MSTYAPTTNPKMTTSRVELPIKGSQIEPLDLPMIDASRSEANPSSRTFLRSQSLPMRSVERRPKQLHSGCLPCNKFQAPNPVNATRRTTVSTAPSAAVWPIAKSTTARSSRQGINTATAGTTARPTPNPAKDAFVLDRSPSFVTAATRRTMEITIRRPMLSGSKVFVFLTLWATLKCRFTADADIALLI